MRRCTPFTSVVLATLSAAIPLSGPAAAAEGGASSGPYLRVFGGYSLLDEPSIKGDNITNGSTGNGNGRGALHQSGGPWGGVAAGYRWGVLRLEGMGSYESHSLKSFDSPQFSYVDTAGTRRTELNAAPSLDGDLKIFTGFLNAVLDVKFGSAFEPFVGAGIGFAHVGMNDVTGRSNISGASFNLTDSTDTVLAFQALVGFAYRFTPTFAAEAGYRFLSLNDPSFRDNLGGSFDLGIEAHQVWLGLRVDF
ncbi:MAG: outer membrane protein [Rhodospirillales bacterium]